MTPPGTYQLRNHGKSSAARIRPASRVSLRSMMGGVAPSSAASLTRNRLTICRRCQYWILAGRDGVLDHTVRPIWSESALVMGKNCSERLKISCLERTAWSALRSEYW